MRVFEDYRDQFRSLYDAVKSVHGNSGRPHRGHGFDHDVTVAMTAVFIAPSERVAERAFCAGLMHSADHCVTREELGTTLNGYLSKIPRDFSDKELAEIKEAVLRHREYKGRNLKTRKPTQRTLMDADKLVNMEPLVIARSGQFHPGIPAIETHWVGKRGGRYANPASTYANPCNLLDDIRGCAEWAEPGWMHYPISRQLATVRAGFIVDFIRRAEDVYHPLGLAGVEL